MYIQAWDKKIRKSEQANGKSKHQFPSYHGGQEAGKNKEVSTNGVSD